MTLSNSRSKYLSVLALLVIVGIIFSGPVGSEELRNQIVTALCIIIERRSKGRPRKMKAKLRKR